MDDKEIGAFPAKFDEYKGEKKKRKKVRKENQGKTNQFWLVYYLDIIQNQHLLHTAIQMNNFHLRLQGLKTILPCFFLQCTYKQNYV